MTNKAQFQPRVCSDTTVTILDGQTVSSAAYLEGTSLVAVNIPAGFDGTALTFQVSSDGTTYYDYKKMLDGTAVVASVGANAAYATLSTDFSGYNYIKLVAGTSQTGDITLTLVTRPLN